jgi:hypothetical protein
MSFPISYFDLFPRTSDSTCSDTSFGPFSFSFPNSCSFAVPSWSDFDSACFACESQFSSQAPPTATSTSAEPQNSASSWSNFASDSMLSTESRVLAVYQSTMQTTTTSISSASASQMSTTSAALPSTERNMSDIEAQAFLQLRNELSQMATEAPPVTCSFAVAINPQIPASESAS